MHQAAGRETYIYLVNFAVCWTHFYSATASQSEESAGTAYPTQPGQAEYLRSQK